MMRQPHVQIEKFGPHMAVGIWETKPDYQFFYCDDADVFLYYEEALELYKLLGDALGVGPKGAHR